MNSLKIKNYKLKIIFPCIGIILLALFLRTYNLFSIPVFADEAIYIRWAQVMRAVSSLRFLPLSDGKQPFFMWLEIPFLKVIQDPIVAGRSVSILAGLGTLVAVFLLANQLSKDKKAALFASLLYAVSPFSVFFDRMALADSLLTMFGVWSLFLGVLTAQTLRLDTAMLTGFTLGFAWLTKSPAMFFFLLLPSTIFLVDTKKRHWFAKLIGLWLVSWAIGFGMYNILRLGPEFHMIAIRNKDYVFPLTEILKNPSDSLIPHLGYIRSWFINLFPLTTLLLAVWGMWATFKKNKKASLILLVWSIVPLLIVSSIARVFTARYILFTLPPLFIFGGFGLKELTKFKWFPLVLATSLIVPLWIDKLLLTTPEKAPLPKNERSGYLEEWTAGQGIREIAQYVKSEKQKNPSQNILVGTEGFFGTLPDGLQIYLSDIPGIVVKGFGALIFKVDSSLTNAKGAGDRVFLVVNSTRLKITQLEEEGLSVVSQYPKAIRNNGTRESLILLELTK